MGSNFDNGALVFRVWRFDGSTEVMAKFQYFGHAETFAKAMAESDHSLNKDVFWIAVCDHQNAAVTFGQNIAEATK